MCSDVKKFDKHYFYYDIRMISFNRNYMSIKLHILISMPPSSIRKKLIFCLPSVPKKKEKHSSNDMDWWQECISDRGFKSLFPGLIELFILKQSFSWLLLPFSWGKVYLLSPWNWNHLRKEKKVFRPLKLNIRIVLSIFHVTWVHCVFLSWL